MFMFTGETWGRDPSGLETNTHTLLYVRQTTNKGLLSSTANSTQYSGTTHVRKESKKE